MSITRDHLVGLLRAWGRILTGRQPSLSIEVTRECPLSCPGCYAYGVDHLGGAIKLREMRDHTGASLVQGVLALVDRHRPLHVSLVGGEPLVRYRELSEILPRLAARGVFTQLVTSAVRQIPVEWAAIPRLQVVVSVDGLQPEHDARRAPATYQRILQHIEGHHITVHCTVTRNQVRRPGYLEEFVRFWSANANVSQLWISLYTPQVGERSAERLTPSDRRTVIDDLLYLRTIYPKLRMPEGMIKVYAQPPASPDKCAFAMTTACVSADLQTRITPCQFGGKPDCANCGCIASAALSAISRHQLPGGLRVGAIFNHSYRIGRRIAATRRGDIQSPQ
jgi:MoaA/NifB/PqqE/SkfB family radical SAM enzyme